jgi:predicted ATPase
MRRWERARQGDGQLVLIVSEPGLGKSRLIEEFHARLRETPHTWVEWSCSQLLQNTPLVETTEIAGILAIIWKPTVQPIVARRDARKARSFNVLCYLAMLTTRNACRQFAADPRHHELTAVVPMPAHASRN